MSTQGEKEPIVEYVVKTRERAAELRSQLGKLMYGTNPPLEGDYSRVYNGLFVIVLRTEEEWRNMDEQDWQAIRELQKEAEKLIEEATKKISEETEEDE